MTIEEDNTLEKYDRIIFLFDKIDISSKRKPQIWTAFRETYDRNI